MKQEPKYEYLSDSDVRLRQAVDMLRILAIESVLLSDELAQLLKARGESNTNNDTNTFCH